MRVVVGPAIAAGAGAVGSRSSARGDVGQGVHLLRRSSLAVSHQSPDDVVTPLQTALAVGPSADGHVWVVYSYLLIDRDEQHRRQTPTPFASAHWQGQIARWPTPLDVVRWFVGHPASVEQKSMVKTCSVHAYV